uniref:T-complex protein 1 subunit eta n=1 Tax=Meleagris gallopavo TaxID=9103 RepID=A0A803Y4Z1_MELGA
MLWKHMTPFILLKEGTDTSQGIPQLVSNINACQVIAEAVRTTLGPRGMDKLIVDDRGECCTAASLQQGWESPVRCWGCVFQGGKDLVWGLAAFSESLVGKATISNDGATILKLLDVVHPAAKTLVDIAKSQDAEVGGLTWTGCSSTVAAVCALC